MKYHPQIIRTQIFQLNLKLKDFLNLIRKISNLLIQKSQMRLEKDGFLFYEFNTTTYAGIYKEKLQLRGDKLILTESRSAVMAIATNCNTAGFTNNNKNRKYTNKQNDALESNITFRLFTSSN